jgi:hypothetical protein
MAKPKAIPVATNEPCYLGCGQVAKFQFSKSGKLCCSEHYNSCPAKRQKFSDLDHTERCRKSLETRITTGVTKSSQVKGSETRKKNGHYQKLAEKMREHWINRPWNNHRTWSEHSTGIMVQSSYEEAFLDTLVQQHGVEWVRANVSRGQHFWYVDPITGERRLYLSDFMVEGVVVEVKGSYTWDERGTNEELRARNLAKLDAAKREGFEVKLIFEW